MTDHELLRELQAALAPDPTLAPPPATFVALHRAIDAATFPARPVPVPRSRPRLFTVLVAAGAVAAVILGLLAVTTPFSRVVREAAHDVGLPVDSPALLDARARRDELRAAVERRDLDSVARTLQRLRAALAKLDDDELLSLQPEVDQLVARAEALVAPPPSTTPTSAVTTTAATTVPVTMVAGSPSNLTTVTTSAAPRVTAPSVNAAPTTTHDDHSGRGDGGSSGGPGPSGGANDDGATGDDASASGQSGSGQSGSGSGGSGSGSGGSGSGSGGGQSGSGQSGSGSGGGGSG